MSKGGDSSVAFQDRQLTCQDCGKEFTFTANEQEFYSQKGFSDPKRCPSCRAAKKAMSGNDHRGHGQRQAFPITCSNCGKQDTVPFEPRGDKPVLCRDCFNKSRMAA